MESKRDFLNELVQANQLNVDEDIFKRKMGSKDMAFITRTGIEKIQFNIKSPSFLLLLLSQMFCARLDLSHAKEGRGYYSVDGISVAGLLSSSPISEKKIIKIIDLLGRTVSQNKKNIVLLYLYDDGSVERKYIVK